MSVRRICPAGPKHFIPLLKHEEGPHDSRIIGAASRAFVPLPHICGQKFIYKILIKYSLIATLAIECGVKANILGADTRNIDGRAFGTMLLGLPEDGAEKALGYIRAQRDITVEEVPDYHG